MGMWLHSSPWIPASNMLLKIPFRAYNVKYVQILHNSFSTTR